MVKKCLVCWGTEGACHCATPVGDACMDAVSPLALGEGEVQATEKAFSEVAARLKTAAERAKQVHLKDESYSMKPVATRLFDYLTCLGPNSSGVNKRRERNARHNSHSILPITRITLETCCKKDLSDLPSGYEAVLGLDKKPVNIGGLLSRKLSVLCISRALCEDVDTTTTNTALLPIRDILRITRYEVPPPNYKSLEGVPLCCSRVSQHEPLIDIVIIKSGEKCPQDFIELNQPLNPGGVVGHLFLCYRRQSKDGREEAFEPELLSCYPRTEHADFKLDFQAVSLLCFPRGIVLSSEPSLPRFFTFVLTGGDGSEVYGSSLIFYEEYGEGTEQKTRYAGKAMCVLSHYPFYQEFRQFVGQLYQIAVSSNTLPLEFWISHFYWTVPVPQPAQRVTYLMGHSKLVFDRPLALGLPLLPHSFSPLFTCLKIDDVITIYEHCLGEGKIVLYSNSYQGLTIVLEALRALLFPFKWQGLFIPILPSNLSYSLRAPVPFLIGLHRSFLQEVRVSEEVLLVDLDRGDVRLPAEPAKQLPAVLKTYLRTQLAEFVDLYREGDKSSQDESLFCHSEEGLSHEDCQEIRVLFLRVLSVFLGDYRKALRLTDKSANAMLELTEVFDCEGFVKRQLHPDFHAFAVHLTGSQLFADFIMHRVLPPLGTDLTRQWQLLYFDWCLSLFHAPDFVPQPEVPEEFKSEKETKSMQMLKKAKETVKAVQVKLGNVGPEFRLEPGKLSAANLDQLSKPHVKDVVVPQPDPDLTRCSYAKFPTLEAALFQQFDSQFAPLQSHVVSKQMELKQGPVVKHISDMTTLLISALAELPRAAFVLSQGETDKSRVHSCLCDIYEMWFLLCVCHYRGSTREQASLLLLSLLTQAYSMIKVTGVPLTESILSALCGFCVANGLDDSFHILYRLSCHTMPSPSMDFFLFVSHRLYVEQSSRDPPLLTSFLLPECIETRSQCSACGYDLPGVDILGTFLAHQCPMCSAVITPELVVWHNRQDFTCVPFLRPPTIKQLLLNNPDGQPGDILDRVRSSVELFWNLFWYFGSRGSISFGLAELPWMFLFNNLPSAQLQACYLFRAPIWAPWRLIQQGAGSDLPSAERDREQLQYWEARGSFNELDLESLKKTRPWSVAVLQDAAATRPKNLMGAKFLLCAIRRILEYRTQTAPKVDTQSTPSTPMSSSYDPGLFFPAVELQRDNSALSLSTFLSASPKKSSSLRRESLSISLSAPEASELLHEFSPRPLIDEKSSEVRRFSETATRRASVSKSGELSRRDSVVKIDQSSMLSQLGALLNELICARELHKEEKADPIQLYLSFAKAFHEAMDMLKVDLVEGVAVSLPLPADCYPSKMQALRTSALLHAFLVRSALGDPRDTVSRFCIGSNPVLQAAIDFCRDHDVLLYYSQPRQPSLPPQLFFAPAFYISLCAEYELRALKSLLHSRDQVFLSFCQTVPHSGTSLSASECAELCIAELKFQEEYGKNVTTPSLTIKQGQYLDDLFVSHAQPLFLRFLLRFSVACEGTGLHLSTDLVASILSHLETVETFAAREDISGLVAHRCYEFSVFEPATNAAYEWLRLRVFPSFIDSGEIEEIIPLSPALRMLKLRHVDTKPTLGVPVFRTAPSTPTGDPPLPPRPQRSSAK